VLPDDVSWFKRSGDTATVGCHSDDVTDTDESTYTLTCVSGRWVGPTQLCSTMSGNVNVALALDRGGGSILANDARSENLFWGGNKRPVLLENDLKMLENSRLVSDLRGVYK